jgi:uncharacterized protein (TIGR02996 family)
VADDPREVVERLLARWQAAPSNAVADALDKLTKAALPKTPPSLEEALEDVLETPRLIDRLREGNAAAAAGQIARIRANNDPRVASAILRFLEDPAWHATGSQPFWKRLFDLLALNPDPRSLPRLKAIKYDKIIHGKSMRGWMIERVKRAAATLEESGISSAKISKEERAELAAIKVSPSASSSSSSSSSSSTGKGSPKKVSEAALLRAVYDAPEDDAPRAVLADYLIERGDPRGELIALQLGERSAAGEKRALTLIRKYQKAWLGPLAPYVHSIANISVDAEDPGWNTIWWNRGFPAGGYLSITKPKLIELADSNLWSTFERLSNLQASKEERRIDPQWDEAIVRLMKSLRGLRSLSGTSVRTLKLGLEGAPQFLTRIERLMLFTRGDDEIADAALHIANGIPKLKRLYVSCVHSGPPHVKPLFASTIVVECDLWLETRGGYLALTDSGRALTIYAPKPSIVSAAKELSGTARAKGIQSLTFANTRSEEQRKTLSDLFPKARVSVLPKRTSNPSYWSESR